MSDILNRPDQVQAECTKCEWVSPVIDVDYSKPNALWTAKSTVTRLHRLHADQEHRQPMPRIRHLLATMEETP